MKAEDRLNTLLSSWLYANIGKHPVRCFYSKIHCAIVESKNSQKETSSDLLAVDKTQAEFSWEKSRFTSFSIRSRRITMNNDSAVGLPTETDGWNTKEYTKPQSHQFWLDEQLAP